MKKLFILLLLVITIAATAQESALLRLKYDKGDQYLMKMTMSQDMSEGMMLMNMDMHMKIDVKDVVDTVFTTEMRFTKVAMNMKQGEMEMSYDSDKKEEATDPGSQQLKAGMEQLLTMVIGVKNNDLGEVLEMKMVQGTGDINQFKQSNNNTVVYPVEAVKVGTSWSEVKENNGMKMNYTYTVESIDKKSVVLTVTGDISEAAEGTFNGKMNINRSNGLPTDSSIDMIMKVMGQDTKLNIGFTFEKI